MSKQQLDVIEDHMDGIPDIEETVLPPTYIVLQVPADIPAQTLEWLIDKIRGKKRDGGGELIVMKQAFKQGEDYVLHLSASKIKFLEVAEDMELIKEDRNGQMREFTVAQLEDFLPEDAHVDELLTMAERQNIVSHELENIRALAEDDHIPGYPNSVLYEGQSIFQALQQYDIVTKMFPLHDEEALKKLGSNW